MSEEESKPVEAEIIEPGKDTLAVVNKTMTDTQITDAVEEIVEKWNAVIKNFENTTITLCMMIKERLKDCPDESVKEILQRVKKHPNIKRFVSVDRIWQGMRLIKERPELIQYHNMDAEARTAVSESQTPYMKQDGTINWEFYFQLVKQKLSPGVLQALEMEGKSEGWSVRQLKQKIEEARDEMEHPGEFETRRKEKHELIRKVLAIMRQLPVENIRRVYTFAQDLQKERMGFKE
jgi:hypothetical protein